MKITSIDVMALDASLDEKLVWRPIVCRINTDQGIQGYGEAAMAFGNGARGAFGMLKELAELVVGMDPLHNEVIWNKLYRRTVWGQNGGAAVFAAISAIDVALWDIKGKYHGLPIHQLLGGASRKKLRCYASQIQMGWSSRPMPCTTPEAFAAATQAAVDAGFDAVKVDFLFFDQEGKFLDSEETTRLLPPHMLGALEARIAAVREVLGTGGDMILEGHSATDVPSAIQFGRLAQRYGVLYYEEPTTPSPTMYRRVADHVDIPLAGGERMFGRWDYLPYLEQGSIQVFQPDLGTAGGITEVKKIADLAAAYGMSVQLHVCGSPLSVAAALQLEAVLPNFAIHEHHILSLHPVNQDLCVNDYQPVNGYIEVPDLPGLGNDLSKQAVEKAHIETIRC